MKLSDSIDSKILSLQQLQAQVQRWNLLGKTVAFTNGCFDILHEGHLAILGDAAQTADKLVVAINTDQSVKKLKGEERPVNNEMFRAKMLASLLIVDAVVLFNENTPINLINAILPDVLVKGGDYTIESIVGSKEVLDNGGSVKVVPFVEGYSTTTLIKKIQQL